MFAWRCIITRVKYQRLPSAEPVASTTLFIRHTTMNLQNTVIWQKPMKKLLQTKLWKW